MHEEAIYWGSEYTRYHGQPVRVLETRRCQGRISHIIEFKNISDENFYLVRKGNKLRIQLLNEFSYSLEDFKRNSSLHYVHSLLLKTKEEYLKLILDESQVPI